MSGTRGSMHGVGTWRGAAWQACNLEQRERHRGQVAPISPPPLHRLPVGTLKSSQILPARSPHTTRWRPPVRDLRGASPIHSSWGGMARQACQREPLTTSGERPSGRCAGNSREVRR
eukprot:214880-Chlamydomonas_euryale.AAC.8